MGFGIILSVLRELQPIRVPVECSRVELWQMVLGARHLRTVADVVTSPDAANARLPLVYGHRCEAASRKQGTSRLKACQAAADDGRILCQCGCVVVTAPVASTIHVCCLRTCRTERSSEEHRMFGWRTRETVRDGSARPELACRKSVTARRCPGGLGETPLAVCLAWVMSGPRSLGHRARQHAGS